MDRHTPPTGNKSDDMFAGQRMTTKRESHQYVVDAFDANPQATLLLGYQLKQRLQRAAGLFAAAVQFIRRDQFDDGVARGDPAISDGR